MLHNVAQMVKEAGMLELLEALAQNLLKCKNARRRVCVFSVVAASFKIVKGLSSGNGQV